VIAAERLRRLPALFGEAPPGSRELLANAGSLVGSVVVTSLLGFPYWWLAARAFSPSAVGFAATAVSAMTLLGTFGMLGLGTLLTGELPRRERGREAFLATSLAICTSAGLLLGLAFALIAAPALGLRGLASRPLPIAIFAVGVALTAVTLVADQALVGLLRGKLQLQRNIIFSAAKLVLLIAIAAASWHVGGIAIYATWVVGLGISIAWLVLLVARDGGVRRYRPRWEIVREWRRPALEHHLLNLAIQGPTLAMPLVITATISVTASAYFYTASLITSFMAYGAIALSYALYAVGVRDPAQLARALRFTLRLSFAVIVAANIVLMLGAPVILGIFGPKYSQNADGVLRILGLIVFLVVVKDHYIAIHRIRGTVLQAAKLCLLGGAMEIGLAAIGGIYGGLTSAALGALGALTIEAAVMAPTLRRELRNGHPGHPRHSPASNQGASPSG
jgi:O-antigen/teichoic acid export membrane protein